jgi:molybdate transport system ATP-binding protein
MIVARFEKALHLVTLKVDLFVEETTVILWGESGSGKTTILDCIAGLADPDSGEIVLGERTVFSSKERINMPPRERGIGYVFQDYALFPHLSAAENILLALPRSERGIAAEYLERFGLYHHRKRKPGHLSGGERQRLAFARALAIKPRLLLLDEPFSALDRKTREETYAEFLKLRDELRMSVILVTHNRSEAELLGNRIVELREGRTSDPDLEKYKHIG